MPLFPPTQPVLTIHSHDTTPPSSMNATSLFESWTESLFEPFFQILENPYYSNITEEILGLAKANVTAHVTTLLSTQNNESIAGFTNYLSKVVIEYSRKQMKTPKSDEIDADLQYLASVATALEHCTLAAFANLTRIENVTSMDPLEYVPSINNATENCLIEKGAFSEMQEEFEDKDSWLVLVKFYWFSWAPMTVLFGPMWEILFPCRNQPYQCKGR